MINVIILFQPIVIIIFTTLYKVNTEGVVGKTLVLTTEVGYVLFVAEELRGCLVLLALTVILGSQYFCNCFI